MVYMEKSKLIRRLNFAPDGMELVQKVDKIYLGNTCFIYALADENAEIGNIRETLKFSDSTKAIATDKGWTLE